MSDHVKCIHYLNGISWCGKDIRGEWSFVDFAHAKESELSGSRFIACKSCMIEFRIAVNGVDK